MVSAFVTHNYGLEIVVFDEVVFLVMYTPRLNLTRSYARFERGHYRTTPDRHYAIEMVLSRSGRFSVQMENEEFPDIAAAIIPSNCRHMFDATNAYCEIWFIDPLCTLGRTVRERFLVDHEPIVVPKQSALEQLLYADVQGEEPDTQEPEVADTTFDPRILRCLYMIDKQLPYDPLHISDLCDSAYLSESRLSHLFTQQLGISVRQYVLWRKVFQAVTKASNGFSLTQAAPAAGFVDSSHFSRVFASMFGVAPRFALK